MNVDINKIKTIAELEEFRTKINEECDARKQVLTVVDKAMDISKQDFGYLKESFENIAPSLWMSSNGKETIKKYKNTIKENKELLKLHNLYENIRKANKNSDIDFFVNSVVSKDWNINTAKLDEGLKKLGAVVAEGYTKVFDKADALLPKKDGKLYSAVKYITENKKSEKNIYEYSEAVKVLREKIESNDEKESLFESKADEKLADSVRLFNEKYENELDEKEKAIVKEMAESNDSKTVFNKYKKLCEDKIKLSKDKFDSEGDSESSKKVSTILEQVSKKEYSKETVYEDVCKLIELSEVFEQ